MKRKLGWKIKGMFFTGLYITFFLQTTYSQPLNDNKYLFSYYAIQDSIYRGMSEDVLIVTETIWPKSPCGMIYDEETKGSGTTSFLEGLIYTDTVIGTEDIPCRSIDTFMIPAALIKTISSLPRRVKAKTFSNKLLFRLPIPYYDYDAPNGIYPGDVVIDGAANVWDLAPIGHYFGDEGPERPSTSIDWKGQYGLYWGRPEWATIGYYYDRYEFNLRHVDCNGNGIIDTNDVDAIIQNYNPKSNLAADTNGYGIVDTINWILPKGPLLSLNVPQNIQPGDTVDIPITLGTKVKPSTDVHHIAFSLNYSNDIIDSNFLTISFDSSWFGKRNKTFIALHKNLPDLERLDIGISNITKDSIIGSGEIARMTIVVNNDIVGKTNLEKLIKSSFKFNKISVFKDFIYSSQHQKLLRGIIKSHVSVDNDLIDLATPSTVLKINKEKVLMSPNPTTGDFSLSGDIQDVQQIWISSLDGKTVFYPKWSRGSHIIKVNGNGLPSGIYTLVLQDLQGQLRQRKLVKY